MSSPRPDFSPRMLALFLRARAEARIADSGRPWRRAETLRAFRAEMRSLAGLTGAQMQMAWMGLLADPAARARLWAVLGHFPADHGIRLTHGGQDDG